jgi:hypothetical protein
VAFKPRGVTYKHQRRVSGNRKHPIKFSALMCIQSSMITGKERQALLSACLLGCSNYSDDQDYKTRDDFAGFSPFS